MLNIPPDLAHGQLPTGQSNFYISSDIPMKYARRNGRVAIIIRKQPTKYLLILIADKREILVRIVLKLADLWS